MSPVIWLILSETTIPSFETGEGSAMNTIAAVTSWVFGVIGRVDLLTGYNGVHARDNVGTVLRFSLGTREFTLDIERGLTPDNREAACGYVAAALLVIRQGYNLLEQQVWTVEDPDAGHVHAVVVKANECYIDGVVGVTDFRVNELPNTVSFREQACPDCGADLTQPFNWGCYSTE